MKHKLIFLRRFNPQRELRPDGEKKGFVYRHEWPTGYQELVFDTKEQAKEYEQKLNEPPANK